MNNLTNQSVPPCIETGEQNLESMQHSSTLKHMENSHCREEAGILCCTVEEYEMSLLWKDQNP